ncbi:MAG: hypothetical protein EOP34_07665 [Rickettsiales bacterium]|nr:MAG: hypothetical protein EOP34_07665 [Rickettsiales bacterium]
MITKIINTLQDFAKPLEEDYNKIVQSGYYSQPQHQWQKQGDKFEIFTLYKDTTPVIASSSTTVISGTTVIK